MTILFMGGELGAFTVSGSGATESASGTFSSTFARCALFADGNVGTPDVVYFESASWTNQTGDLFLHFEEADGSPSTTTHTVLTLVNGSGTEIFRIRQAYVSASTRTWQMQYLNSSAAWANAGSAITLSTSRTNYDLFTDIDGDAMILYVAGSERASMSGTDLSHLSGVTKCRLYSDAVGRSFSQVIVSTESTIGGRLFTVPVSGAGATSQWTGTYANIDEITASDADFINSSVADQVSTFALTMPTLTGYQVRAVGVTARAKRGASGPANLQLALRSNSTNYFSASIALGIGLTSNVAIWETDPATSAAWVNAAAITVQAGVKSIT